MRKSTEQSSPHCAHLHFQMHVRPTTRQQSRKVPVVMPSVIAHIETRAESNVTVSVVCINKLNTRLSEPLQHPVRTNHRTPVGVGLSNDIHPRAMLSIENASCKGEHTLTHTFVDTPFHASNHLSTTPNLGVLRVTFDHWITFLTDGMPAESTSENVYPHASTTPNSLAAAIPEITNPCYIRPHHSHSILPVLVVFTKDVNRPVIWTQFAS